MVFIEMGDSFVVWLLLVSEGEDDENKSMGPEEVAVV